MAGIENPENRRREIHRINGFRVIINDIMNAHWEPFAFSFLILSTYLDSALLLIYYYSSKAEF